MKGTDRLRKLSTAIMLRGSGIDTVLLSIADQIEREHAEDCFRMGERGSEDAEVVAWVRDHGGIGGIERTIASLNDRVWRRQRQIDESHAALRRRNELLDQYRTANDTLLERCAKMKRRLVPEGMEWLLEAWPRFEDDAPVKFGDEVPTLGIVNKIILFPDWSFSLEDGWACHHYKHGERVKRPAPKALDADGVEIRVGDTVWDVEFGCEFVVTKVADGTVFVAFEDVEADRRDPANLTHRAPVLAADGRPLREGETVYLTRPWLDKNPMVVERLESIDGAVKVWFTDGEYDWPKNLTHERPDSWERLEKDATKNPFDYCKDAGIDVPDPRDGIFISDVIEPFAKDLVRRAKALAERDA